MIKISYCTIALLLSTLALAAPAAIDPLASASSSALASSASGLVSSAGASGVSPALKTKPASTSSQTKVASSTSSAAESTATVPFIKLDPNGPLWNSSVEGSPQAIRGSLGATILGPTDDPTVKENPDLLAPPTTDHGSVDNAKWPFSLSHNRLQTGGWARQENMGIRSEGKLSQGNTQVTSVDQNGKNFIATLSPGDLWYFPPGVPHSLQATADDPDGSEFILVFPNGAFSEDSTFLLTDWLAHVPAEVLAKNFQTDISAFAHIPSQELYIFPSTPPTDSGNLPTSPQGLVDNPFTFSFSKMEPTKLSGGSVKIVDSRTFKVSTAIAAAEVTVEPGAMRELHWHPTQDEWSFFLEGEGRVTIFAAQSNARTFNYQAGDIGYVPATMGHYVENTGNSTLRFLEIFNTDMFEDISLSNWLALTPPELVKAHLGFDDATIAKLQKTKPTVIGPA
ncbi:Oxalate decarboxylase OxdC [Psilocybe cubensis]|uniref:Oxalate decarboxylase OxdC n=1 Tax=Psilocybe cubensis TaxID=181762 RepID=A0ACB8H2I2_PSICU|nr:Oxalate decarboxylase OxdC [Psilocybe cubensis]KAH9481877.1 Oxalate decarboxylase OxdC [Psilocybe cubensis]